jgi:hypothetical protein
VCFGYIISTPYQLDYHHTTSIAVAIAVAVAVVVPVPVP